MPKFSDRFKQLRTERRLSQQNLADQLGFSKSSVNMYERGEREPGLESMETIADYFNVDLDYLMGRSDIPNRNDWLKSINKSVVVEPSQPQMKFDNIIPISTKHFPYSVTLLAVNPSWQTKKRNCMWKLVLTFMLISA